jgi:nucleoside-diphosphate-sugar epimerase
MAKILITGVAGFIGSNLARALLDRGEEVIGIDNLSQGARENLPVGVEFHRLDVRHAAIYPLFQGVDTVFHLAAKNCLSDCLAHPVETSEINVVGTVQVLEAARRAGIRKLIYADSSAEYEGVQELPSSVERVCPVGPYAVSKRCGALFCESYRQMFGLNITVLRYFNVYGPAQDWRRVIPPVMSAFILKLLSGEPPAIYGTGHKRRDFIYVDDVNDFHMRAMTDPRTDGRTFNVGSGVNYSVLEIFQLIEGFLQTGLKPVYRAELPGDTEATLADLCESLALGWRPHVGIEEGLQRTIAHIRSHVWKGPSAVRHTS